MIQLHGPQNEREPTSAASHDEDPIDRGVVGSHGRSGVRRLLLGSVAAHVVTHSPCNVLVIKSPWQPA
jgi:nucleotide-binding universal stress UspA family protein